MNNSSAAYNLTSQVGEDNQLYFTVVTNPDKYKLALQNLSPEGTIYCKTIDGSTCDSNKCIGFCWSKLHKGFITQNLLKQHQCMEKNCPSFQKFSEANYWIEKENKIIQKKNIKQMKKEIAVHEEKILLKIRNLTIHDLNFYPISVEFKDNSYEVRIINFDPIDYSYYLNLFKPVIKGKKIHFSKIKTNRERKRLIIERYNIIKIPVEVPPIKSDKSITDIDVVDANNVIRANHFTSIKNKILKIIIRLKSIILQ